MILFFVVTENVHTELTEIMFSKQIDPFRGIVQYTIHPNMITNMLLGLCVPVPPKDVGWG